MKYTFNKFFQISGVLTAILWATGAHSVGSANPRSAAADTGARTSRTASRVVTRDTNDSARNSVASTARTSVGQKKVVVGRGTSDVSRTAKVGLISRNAVSAPRSAMTAISRSAVRPFGGAHSARSAKKVSDTGLARSASTARATAVFNDISKIGGGYAACRESYATCMDQFCANANDTFRRCYCSEKFTNFRDTENALDQAKVLLQQFEDNNLNAVDKSAAEVDAMYSATIGEAAIKTDVSGAQALLNSIGDLLSGKKTSIETPVNTNSGSLGILSLDFSTDMDDVWSGGGSSFFGDDSSATDMTALEGKALFNTSNKQCLEIISDSCENQAVLNMATSAYGIMIAQDCNMYEKSVEKKREQVKQAVRQAEKVLRDARLEEYRAHNSADVNECMTKVQNAIKTDVACGPNYERCLDYTGMYINQSTGEPIYSTELFDLENLIDLETESSDKTQKFYDFLDGRKMFATSALDSCRDIADTVWTEFKRAALIEIAQAQDEKIEEVKMSCVSTMAECYDRQAGALKEFDTTKSQNTGAISAYAAKSMCADKVAACAALYGCGLDDNKLKRGESCPLWTFVDAVDDTRVAEGCADAVQKYVNDLCTPSSGDKGFPWNCRNLMSKTADTTSFAMSVQKRALELCKIPTSPESVYTDLDDDTQAMVTKIIDDTTEQLEYQLRVACTELDGYWYTEDYNEKDYKDLTLLAAFYSSVYGRTPNSSEIGKGMGACIENTTMVRCLDYNTGEEEKVATYDEKKDECVFTDKWYKDQCETVLDGYYENGICYMEDNKENSQGS